MGTSDSSFVVEEDTFQPGNEAPSVLPSCNLAQRDEAEPADAYRTREVDTSAAEMDMAGSLVGQASYGMVGQGVHAGLHQSHQQGSTLGLCKQLVNCC